VVEYLATIFVLLVSLRLIRQYETLTTEIHLFTDKLRYMRKLQDENMSVITDNFELVSKKILSDKGELSTKLSTAQLKVSELDAAVSKLKATIRNEQRI